LQRARDDARKRIADSFSGEYVEEEEETEENTTSVRPPAVRRPPEPRPVTRSRFSSQEKRDIAIASVLVSLVALSMIGYPTGILRALLMLPSIIAAGLWWYPTALVVIFLSSFMIHELAHKFVAQHYGMWSEFRMLPYGYILSAMAILISFPVFGTGAVFTSGSTSPDRDAKSTLAGPLSNAILAMILTVGAVIAFLFTGLHYPLASVLQIAAFLNCMLGLFNLIPFPPFDGARIVLWRKGVWAAMIVVLITLLIGDNWLFPMLWS
jgi:Zn-dependent protease